MCFCTVSGCWRVLGSATRLPCQECRLRCCADGLSELSAEEAVDCAFADVANASATNVSVTRTGGEDAVSAAGSVGRPVAASTASAEQCVVDIVAATDD